MAKGEQRSNREAKKPKKEKIKVIAAAPSQKGAGWQPTLRLTNGGLDANWMVRHGIPTVTFGAGQNDIHTVKEWVDVPEFLEGCRLAVALAKPD